MSIAATDARARKYSPAARRPLIGVTGRFVRKLHVKKQKAQRNQRLSNTVVCAWIAIERQILGIFLSKPSFRTNSKGNGHLKGPLACDFGTNRVVTPDTGSPAVKPAPRPDLDAATCPRRVIIGRELFGLSLAGS